MGKSSRRKGAYGEREVRDILRAHGFTCERDGRLDTDLKHDCDGYHLEVKRRETLAIPAWMRQARAESGGKIPVVVYRRSREEWMAVLPFERLAHLLRIEAIIKAKRRYPRDPPGSPDVPWEDAS